ncbi:MULTISPECIES: hypothetical protein [unclassified Clostridium]|nr:MULTISPECIES: hypothetical protein [unclassified Clostridium]
MRWNCQYKEHSFGIGTVVSVLGVGRVIAAFNHFFMERMVAAADVE